MFFYTISTNLKMVLSFFFRFVEPTTSQCHSTTKSWLNLEWDFWICRSNAATKLLIRLRTLTALNHSSSEMSQRRGQIKVISGASTQGGANSVLKARTITAEQENFSKYFIPVGWRRAMHDLILSATEPPPPHPSKKKDKERKWPTCSVTYKMLVTSSSPQIWPFSSTRIFPSSGPISQSLVSTRDPPPLSCICYVLIDKYSPKRGWIVVDIYRTSKRQGKYPD